MALGLARGEWEEGRKGEQTDDPQTSKEGSVAAGLQVNAEILCVVHISSWTNNYATYLILCGMWEHNVYILFHAYSGKFSHGAKLIFVDTYIGCRENKNQENFF